MIRYGNGVVLYDDKKELEAFLDYIILTNADCWINNSYGSNRLDKSPLEWKNIILEIDIFYWSTSDHIKRREIEKIIKEFNDIFDNHINDYYIQSR